MKKVIPIFMTVTLLVQSLLSPVMAFAEAVTTKEVFGPTTLTQGNANLTDESGQLISTENPLKNETVYQIVFNGVITKEDVEREQIQLTVSDNFNLRQQTVPLADQESLEIGRVITNSHSIMIELDERAVGQKSISIILPVTYNSPEKLTSDELQIQTPTELLTKEYSVFQKIEESTAVEPTSESTTSSSSESTTSSTSSTSESTKTSDVPKKRNLGEAREPIIESIIDDVTIEITPDPEKPTIKSKVKVNYTWSLPESLRETLKAGDTYSFNLPKELKVASAISDRELTNASGEVVAKYRVSATGEVTFTFTDAVERLENIKGTFWFETMFDEKVVTSPENVVIKFPLKYEDKEITIPIKSLIEESLEKTGKFDRDVNPTKAIWNVYVNKAKLNLSNLAVKDALPKELALVGIKVYEVMVNHEGKITNDNVREVPKSEYSENGTAVTFPGPTSKAYRVEYETKIKDEYKPTDSKSIQLTNEVSQTSKEGKPLTASSTLTATYGKMLEKEKKDYNARNQTFNWRIKYNYGEKEIAPTQGYLQDTPSDNVVFVESSLVVKKVVPGENGNFTEIATLVRGVDYDLVPVGNGFKLQFKNNIDYAVNVEYDTKIKDGLTVGDEAVIVTNEVKTSGSLTASSSGETRQNNLIKYETGHDYDKKTVNWTVVVNENKYEMTKWHMVDTFENDGLTFLPESIKMSDSDGNVLVKGTDYELIVKDPKKGFEVKLIGKYLKTNKTFEMSYQTAFNKNEMKDPSYVFLNNAKATWINHNGQEQTNTSSSYFQPNTETYNNGSKNGSYNAVSKEITWTVDVNYNRDEFNGGQIIDPIKGNQEYLPGKATLETFKLKEKGEIEILSVTTLGDDILQTRDGVPTLVVDLPATTKDVGYRLTFKTSLVGKLIQDASTYDNTATLEVDGKVKDTLNGGVSITNGGIFASKGGVQNKENPDTVSWQVLVNQSQSTINKFVVTDIPSSNQVIDQNTLVVTEMESDSNGNLSKSSKVLVKDIDYKATYSRNVETGSEEMSIAFTGTISKAYTIEYISELLLASGEKEVSNKVSISGENEQVITKSVESKVPVEVSEGGGTGGGEWLNVYLKKVDNHGNPLAGIQFELLHGKTKVSLRKLVTDESGMINVTNILSGKYYLKEISQPDGFYASGDLKEGRLITVSKANSDVSNPIVVENVLNEVTLKKIDEQGNPIEGAVFGLSKKDSAGAYQPIFTHQNITSDGSGMLSIEGLKKGSYRLVELQSPTGFIKNASPIEFVITGEEKSEVNLGEFKNYKGTAQLLKTDESGKALMGATFKVLNHQLEAVSQVQSDENGIVSIGDLAPGTYTVFEIATPSGYLLNGTPQTFEIKAEETGKPAIVKLANLVNYQGSAELIKRNQKGQLLEGATFGLYNQTDQQLVKSDIVSDKNGKVAVTGLSAGEYYFKETKAAPGYILNTETYKFNIADTATSKPSKVDAGEAINYQGSAKLIKKDESGQKLGGAEFKLTKEDGTDVQTGLTSGNNGEVIVEGLAPGNYFFVETNAPSGYILNAEKISFSIGESNEGAPTEVKASDIINYRGSAQLLKTDGNGQPLVGGEFSVRDAKGKIVGEQLVSNEEGLVLVKDLAPGNYAFVETKAPKGFVKDETPKEFTIANSFVGVPKAVLVGEHANYQGSVELVKEDETGKRLADAEFTLYEKSGTIHSENIKTDTSGKLEVVSLAPGSYYFEETKAPAGFILNTTKLHFEVKEVAANKPTQLSVKAVNYQGAAQLTKVDQKGNPLTGASFQIVDKNNKDKVIIENVASTDTGLVKVTGLAPGSYAFVEKQAPAGYILNTKEVVFEIKGELEGKPEMLSLGNFVNFRGRVEFVKVDGTATKSTIIGLEHAKFQLKKEVSPGKNEVLDVAIESTKEGKVIIEQLSPGNYILEEIEAPKGYILRIGTIPFTIPDFYQEAPKNPMEAINKKLIFENYKGSAELTKVGEDGKPLEGAEFKVTNEAGKTVKEGLLSTKEGLVTIEGLAPGKYAFVETKAPKGHVLNDTPVAFEIATESATGKVDVKDLSIVNYQGSVELTKVNDKNQALSEATFNLYQVIDKKAELVKENVATNQTGKLDVKNLAPGHYYFEESKAPTGYILNSTKVMFEIKDVATGQPTRVTVEAVNYQGSAELTKVGEDGKPLEGAEFKVTNEAGKTVKEGLLSTKEGLVTIEGLAPGKYAFVETKAPKGHVLNDTPVAFEIATESATGKVDVKDLSIVNYQGSVELTKVNDKNQALSEATFNLYQVIDKKAELVKENVATNQTGKLDVKNLAPGHYYFEESKAPTGYILNSTKVMFEIKDVATGQPTRVTVEAVNYQGSAELTKVGEDGKPLEGAEFKVTNEAGKTVKEGLLSTKEGLVTIEGLAPGKYAFVETKAPKGHVLNDTPVAFEIATESATGKVDVKELSIVNYQGSVELTKVNDKNQALSEATFNLYQVIDKKAELVKENVATNQTGKLDVKNLAPGHYYFEESKAPTGYILNSTKVMFEIKDVATGQPTRVTVEAVNYQGSVELTKVNAKNQPLSEATFNLYQVIDKKAELVKENVATNQTGKLDVKNLAPGHYYFEESKAPTGYILNSTKVMFEIKDVATGQPTRVTVEAVNYKGSAELTKVGEDGKPLEGAEFKVTNEAGETVKEGLLSTKEGLVTIEGLAPGKYAFVETKAPKGYIRNEKTVSFEISTSSEGKPETVSLGKFINYQGSVELTKVNDKNQALSEATFNLYQVIDKKAELVKENVATNQTGKLDVKNLAPGHYYFEESKAPTGYILNSTKVMFEIKDVATGQPTRVTVEAVNYQGSAELTKVGEDGKPLEGAEFKVTNEAGKTVKEGLLSTKEGLVTIEGLAPGKYAFVETKAPKGYIRNEKTVSFEILTSSEGKPETVSLGKFINYQGSVKLKKVAQEDNRVTLEGAEFKVIDNLGNVIAEKLATDKNGEISVQNLAPGNYAFVETKAPINYELDGTPVNFTVANEASNEPAEVQVLKENKLSKIPKASVSQPSIKGGSGTKGNKVTPESKHLPQLNEEVSITLSLIGLGILVMGVIKGFRRRDNY